MNLRKNKGVTLVALSVTVIVLLILAGIAVTAGTDTIKKAKIEEMKTNMLLIQAKAREYVEEVNFKMGPNPDESKRGGVQTEVYETNAKLRKASGETQIKVPSNSGINLSECYLVTQETLEKMGLNKIKTKPDEYYLIKFDETNVTVEIYNTLGIDGNYSLTQVDRM